MIQNLKERIPPHTKTRFPIGALKIEGCWGILLGFYPISRKIGATATNGFQILREHQKIHQIREK